MFGAVKEWVGSRLLQRLLPKGFYFDQPGFCPCCGSQTRFVAHDPWLRDHFRCVVCRSSPRHRALLTVLERHAPGWATLSMHESSPSRGGASLRLRQGCAGYLATHYFPGQPRGKVVDGFRNEDLGQQTFDDASFDLVVTQDVLEHVYEPARVFQEIARTLKPGGLHVFSVPLVNKHRSSQRWATQGDDGEPVFLHEPDYHGNPIDPRGSPVTMHWGFDIVEHIREACGLDTVIEHPDDLGRGIRAEYIEILVTRKPPRSD
jgi:SAM-dependent methyltransferase